MHLKNNDHTKSSFPTKIVDVRITVRLRRILLCGKIFVCVKILAFVD